VALLLAQGRVSHNLSRELDDAVGLGQRLTTLLQVVGGQDAGILSQVRLLSADKASIELSIARYQFPDLQGHGDRDWDANWLQISGAIVLAGGQTWSFEDPSLTTWEAAELGEWFRLVADGSVKPSTFGTEEAEQLLCFTEPNLAFGLEERVAACASCWTRWTPCSIVSATIRGSGATLPSSAIRCGSKCAARLGRPPPSCQMPRRWSSVTTLRGGRSIPGTTPVPLRPEARRS
jgi:hypothetical protein